MPLGFERSGSEKKTYALITIFERGVSSNIELIILHSLGTYL
jgi:hypothetical protein